MPDDDLFITEDDSDVFYPSSGGINPASIALALLLWCFIYVGIKALAG